MPDTMNFMWKPKPVIQKDIAKRRLSLLHPIFKGNHFMATKQLDRTIYCSEEYIVECIYLPPKQ